MRVLNLVLIVVLSLFSTDPAASFDGTEEEIVFISAGVQLSGTLMTPAPEARAAIVLIQGSGSEERLSRLARAIASRHYAVFTYDKRGVGRSGGLYEGAKNVSAVNLNLLAEDVAAAVIELRKRAALRNLPIGLLGISQAGWIGPLAAVKLGDLNFMGFWGGPTCKISEQLRFQEIEDTRVKNLNGYDSEATVASILAGGDVDPLDSLRRLHLPAMWIFGEADTQVPVVRSVERLELLIAEGHPEFKYRLYPEEGHPALSDRTLGDMLGWLDTTVNASFKGH